MKTKRIVLSLLTILLLTGCASIFDANEHARIVNIHVASIDTTVCDSRDAAIPIARQMHHDATWVWHYSQHLPNNESMAKMSFELVQITKELVNRYEKVDPVSTFYCRNKFENIHRATNTIIKVSARRPRS